MPMSMYAASVPVFQHMLRNLSHILDKAEANQESLMRLMTATPSRTAKSL